MPDQERFNLRYKPTLEPERNYRSEAWFSRRQRHAPVRGEEAPEDPFHEIVQDLEDLQKTLEQLPTGIPFIDDIIQKLLDRAKILEVEGYHYPPSSVWWKPDPRYPDPTKTGTPTTVKSPGSEETPSWTPPTGEGPVFRKPEGGGGTIITIPGSEDTLPTYTWTDGGTPTIGSYTPTVSGGTPTVTGYQPPPTETGNPPTTPTTGTPTTGIPIVGTPTVPGIVTWDPTWDPSTWENDDFTIETTSSYDTVSVEGGGLPPPPTGFDFPTVTVGGGTDATIVIDFPPPYYYDPDIYVTPPYQIPTSYTYDPYKGKVLHSGPKEGDDPDGSYTVIPQVYDGPNSNQAGTVIKVGNTDETTIFIGSNIVETDNDIEDLPNLFPNSTGINVNVETPRTLVQIAQDNYRRDQLDLTQFYLQSLKVVLQTYFAHMLTIMADTGIGILDAFSQEYYGELVDISDPNLRHLGDEIIRRQINRQQKLKLTNKVCGTDQTLQHMRMLHVAEKARERYYDQTYGDSTAYIDSMSNSILRSCRSSYDTAYKTALYNYFRYLDSSVKLTDDILNDSLVEAQAKAKLMKEGVNIFKRPEINATSHDGTGMENVPTDTDTTTAATSTDTSLLSASTDTTTTTTTTPKTPEEIDKANKITDPSEEKAPNGGHYSENDIKYLTDNGYTREAAIEELSKLDKYKAKETTTSQDQQKKVSDQSSTEVNAATDGRSSSKDTTTTTTKTPAKSIEPVSSWKFVVSDEAARADVATYITNGLYKKDWKKRAKVTKEIVYDINGKVLSEVGNVYSDTLSKKLKAADDAKSDALTYLQGLKKAYNNDSDMKTRPECNINFATAVNTLVVEPRQILPTTIWSRYNLSYSQYEKLYDDYKNKKADYDNYHKGGGSSDLFVPYEKKCYNAYGELIIIYRKTGKTHDKDDKWEVYEDKVWWRSYIS